MYRQLYQMGGIGTLPMDYGQSLQVPQQPQSIFTLQLEVQHLVHY
jgi:hypothetical protein